MTLRYGGMLLALLGGIGIAAAQQPGMIDSSASLMLTPQQRSTIHNSVMREKSKVKTQPPAGLPLSVGAQIPPATELHNMPDDIANDLPATKIYQYTLVQNQVVLVDPTTMRIVDIIR